ncbi:hypothetical protein RFI_22806 [Reticulomyxa filosa]|uniref:Transmembrane protein n=1 Tax=Reticulomyxa filosa TaxID=46433 RepID=X6MM98_RETFI|nr:hypothetical protein RFI_22806 [Reticulomyxa filosa]|eukprot:ETO14562.1 hypothetical protein RFI_22806 [Reticulomyxa filosa]
MSLSQNNLTFGKKKRRKTASMYQALHKNTPISKHKKIKNGSKNFLKKNKFRFQNIIIEKKGRKLKDQFRMLLLIVSQTKGCFYLNLNNVYIYTYICFFAAFFFLSDQINKKKKEKKRTNRNKNKQTKNNQTIERIN